LPVPANFRQCQTIMQNEIQNPFAAAAAATPRAALVLIEDDD
jgi:hypothetical protein